MKKIVLDWLSISIKNNGFFNTENSIFDIEDCKTIAQYNKGFSISYKGGQCCARLYYANSLNPLFSMLKIENWCFYRDFSIVSFFNDFFENVGFDFDHVQRIDIACDTDNTLYCGKDPQKFSYGVWRGQYNREAKFNRATKKIILDNVQLIGSKEAETLKIGKDGITLKLYNKTKELIISGKDYISEWWGSVAGVVWRSEISLKYDDLQRMQPDGKIYDYSFKKNSLANGFDFDDLELIKFIYFSVLEQRYKFWIPRRKGAKILTPLMVNPEDQECILIGKGKPKNYDILPYSTYHRGVSSYMYRAASVMGDADGQKMAAAAYDMQNFKGGSRADIFRTIQTILDEERKHIYSKVNEAGELPREYARKLDAVNICRQFFKDRKKAFREAVSNTD